LEDGGKKMSKLNIEKNKNKNTTSKKLFQTTTIITTTTATIKRIFNCNLSSLMQLNH